MLSTGNDALAEQAVATPATVSERPVANLNARISGYLVDSVILLAFILVFFVAGGAVLLFTSDFGAGDPPDWAYYACVALFVGGTLLAWTVFNLALLRWRGQTAGMYVLGIKTVGADGAITTGRLLVRWFGLHPLLFHPLLLPVWAVVSLLLVSFTLNQIVLAVTLCLVLFCIAAFIAGLITMLVDPERRALHDRLAGTLVIHLDRP